MDTYMIEHPEQHTQECLDYAERTGKLFCIAECADKRRAEYEKETRIKRVEAILRDNNFHEPDCPEREREKAQAHTGVYLYGRECTCWLSEAQGSK